MIEEEFEEIGVGAGDVARAAVVGGLAVVGFRSGGEALSTNVWSFIEPLSLVSGHVS